MNEDEITCKVMAYVYEQVSSTDNSCHTSLRPMGFIIKLEAKQYPPSYVIIGELQGLTANAYEDLQAAVSKHGNVVIKESSEIKNS